MGRQITVEIEALEAAGCMFSEIAETYTTEFRTWDGQDADFDTEVVSLVVHLPSSNRRIVSDASDCLVFDCRDMATSANGWMECWLIERGVQYVAG